MIMVIMRMRKDIKFSNRERYIYINKDILYYIYLVYAFILSFLNDGIIFEGIILARPNNYFTCMNINQGSRKSIQSKHLFR